MNTHIDELIRGMKL
jgi:predicted subunit of tRNA(5-methylaminomethyl-2-thiouridylate) methyltransferase